MRSVKEELPRKGGPETRGCSQHRDYDSLPHDGEARGTGAAILGTEIGRRDPPPGTVGLIKLDPFA